MASVPKGLMDRELLQATLEGLRLQRRRIDEQIVMIERMVGGARSVAKTVSPAGSPGRRRRAMSASARKRIADAQKKRWAEYRKKSGKSD